MRYITIKKNLNTSSPVAIFLSELAPSLELCQWDTPSRNHHISSFCLRHDPKRRMKPTDLNCVSLHFPLPSADWIDHQRFAELGVKLHELLLLRQ